MTMAKHSDNFAQAQKAHAAALLEEAASSWRKMSAMVMGLGTGREEHMTARWRQGLVSNFEYLMFLNTCAGRTYNDLTQYPVFPWILADYHSASLHLGDDPTVYRDLSKPMGTQNDERAAIVRDRFRDYDPAEHDSPAFHYGTHYSSAAAVLYYLIRMEPFSSQFVYDLQGGRFDHPDRTFSSVLGTWRSAAGHTGSTSDVKELVPEWFTMSEFLRNTNRLNLGCRTGGAQIDDVELPPWALDSPQLFVLVHRMALESEYVSAHLHEWIDLIFGYKQRGPDAVNALNVFHFLSYEGEVSSEWFCFAVWPFLNCGKHNRSTLRTLLIRCSERRRWTRFSTLARRRDSSSSSRTRRKCAPTRSSWGWTIRSRASTAAKRRPRLRLSCCASRARWWSAWWSKATARRWRCAGRCTGCCWAAPKWCAPICRTNRCGCTSPTAVSCMWPRACTMAP